MEGLPVDLTHADILCIIEKMKWQAEPVSGSKHCRKGKATWAIKATTPPPSYRFPIDIADENFAVTIATNKQDHVKSTAKPAKNDIGAKTWADLFKGNTVKKEDKLEEEQATNARGQKRNAGHEAPPPQPREPAGHHEGNDSPPKRRRSTETQDDDSMDDSWCEDLHYNEEQERLRQRQDEMDAKLSEILSVLQTLTLAAQRSKEPAVPGVAGPAGSGQEDI